ncbi:MAG: sulfatase [Gemmatimonadetes bacterium]|nr:sulfatase [Gemmatimonadota bacterium]
MTEPTPNIILISIDSLRADRLGVYGHARNTSPNIDRLASAGVVFDNAYSTTSWTLPSHVSMLSGLYPEVHGVRKGKQKVSKQVVLCSEVFERMGYRNMAVVSGPYLNRRFGFNQGFEDYDDRTIRFRSTPASHAGVTSPQQHERIVEVLDTLGEDRFFLFLHYWDVHLDYEPPGRYGTMFDPDYSGDISGRGFLDNEDIRDGMDPRDLEHLLALYDGEIAFTDHHIGLLMDELEQRGLFEQSLIVFTADHGDEFFEHGGKGHRRTLYNESLQVPLIVKFPGGSFAGHRVDSAASLVDIVPTVYDYMDIDWPWEHNGQSLLPAILGWAVPDGDQPRFADLHGEIASAIEGRWKVVRTAGESPTVELYDLALDPGERENLLLEDEDLAGWRSRVGRKGAREARQGLSLGRRLEEWQAAAEMQAADLERVSIEYDEDLRKTLKALGYLD